MTQRILFLIRLRRNSWMAAMSLFLVACQQADARLGDTLDQCMKQYGKPVEVDKANATLVYEVDGMEVRCFFDGKDLKATCIGMSYFPTKTDKQRDKLLHENAGQSKWEKPRAVEDVFSKMIIWKRADGGEAMLTEDGTLICKSPELVKRHQVMTQPIGEQPRENDGSHASNTVGLKDGFRDLKWGQPVSPEFVAEENQRVGGVPPAIQKRLLAAEQQSPKIVQECRPMWARWEGTKTFTRPADNLSVGSAEMSYIVYCFTNNKLTAVILYGSFLEADNLRTSLVEAWGPPRSKGESGEFFWGTKQTFAAFSPETLLITERWVCLTICDLAELNKQAAAASRIKSQKASRAKDDL